ncbi:hypothetical protein [Sphingomonas sp. 3-13AW]|uniref:hypothetical protein n=1 Tax=Sphingomonas sp. 3-13AW TaxID=3050450 RepID=UPI003BB5BD70
MSTTVRPLLRQKATELNEEEISDVGGGGAASTAKYCRPQGGGNVWEYEGTKPSDD